MEYLFVFLASFCAMVSGQRSSFQITSVNGQPVSSSDLNRPQNNNGNSGSSSFSITSVNGRPVNGNGNQGSLIDTNRMRIEAQLVRFENPNSVMFNNQFCDTASKCDPVFTADLDTTTPLAQWPGPKPFSTFQKVLELANTDVFNIGASVVRDVCSSVNLGNLRVQVHDVDDVTQPDLIDEYECIFDIQGVGSDFNNAPWSPVTECKSLHHKTAPFVKLFYRHREYALPRDPFSKC
jgi:hypothetical protein